MKNTKEEFSHPDAEKLPEHSVKVFSNDFGEVFTIEPNIILVRATEAYIPIDSFKELFDVSGQKIKDDQIQKLIFDKRTLSVFHQPSMEWYFTEWKEEMHTHGLTIHRKILPRDPVFRECVKLGRENLAEIFPDAKFHEMDIQYRLSVKEAIES